VGITGEKMILLAEIIRVTTKGATRAEICGELSLSLNQTTRYLRFLEAKELVFRVKKSSCYTASQKGMSYLEMYDDASDILEPDHEAYYSGEPVPGGPGIYWDKREISARMREIIGR
jgi:predicted transcriptional regulator